MLGTGDNQQMLLDVTSSGPGIVPPIVWLSVGNSFLAEGIVVVSAHHLILLEFLFLGSCDEWNTRAPKNAGSTKLPASNSFCASRFQCCFLNKARNFGLV